MKRIGQVYRESLSDCIKDGIKNNSGVFLMSYSNLSSLQVSDLRKNLKKVGADMQVSKNSIARRSLIDLEFEGLASQIAQQTAFIWGNKDSVEISKVLVKFTETAENINIQGGLLEGRVLNKEDVKVLSDLPSRQVLLSSLLGTIQSPLTRLLHAMNAKTRDLLSILKQLSEKK